MNAIAAILDKSLLFGNQMQWTRVDCGHKKVFIKHLFKRMDVLHTECLVEKVINHIVLISTIRFNVKQAKQKKPLKICITWRVAGFLKFYIFPYKRTINMLLAIMFIINTFSW